MSQVMTSVTAHATFEPAQQLPYFTTQIPARPAPAGSDTDREGKLNTSELVTVPPMRYYGG
jgi:hypothetical protein